PISVPVKAFGPPTTNPKDENRDLTRAAESLPDQDEKLDPITRAAFGEVYAEFVAARAGAPQTEDDVEDQDDDDVEDQDDDDVEDQDDDVEIVYTTPDDDPEITADIDTPIPELENDFALPTRTKGTRAIAEQARAA